MCISTLARVHSADLKDVTVTLLQFLMPAEFVFNSYVSMILGDVDWHAARQRIHFTLLFLYISQIKAQFHSSTQQFTRPSTNTQSSSISLTDASPIPRREHTDCRGWSSSQMMAV